MIIVKIDDLSFPLNVGIVGTGYAAQRRAEAFQADKRTHLRFVAGNTPASAATFSQTYSVPASDSWQQLVNHPEIDLVVICTINRDHGTITRAALEAGKHVIIEYPLSLQAKEAEELIALAQQRQKLLHVEHIELLGGLHQAIRQYLPEIGKVFYARYVTIVPKHPAPRRWTYHQEQFGFPLIAAVSRIHRFTDLFGEVASVSCQSRFWDAPEPGYFTSCLCDAQMEFSNGIIANTLYGKGEVFWQNNNTFEISGDQGTIILDSEQGLLIKGEEKTVIEVGARRGLFIKDTQLVLDYLFTGNPLYVHVNASLYALKVADAAYQSTMLGKTVNMSIK